jgi:adenylylsulfate kinase
MYAKVRTNEIKEFTGASSPYEPPVKPEIALDTTSQSVAECVARVLEYIHVRDEETEISI